MGAFDTFGQVWIRLPTGDWRRHLVRECTCCNKLTVQQLQFVVDDSVFCLGCFGTNMRLVDVAGQRMFRCSDCLALTEFDAFLDEPPPEEGFFDHTNADFFMEELKDEPEEEGDDDEDWKRKR